MTSAKMVLMHTSPHPHTTRHPVLLGLLEALRIDLIVVPSAFVVATIFWIIGLGSQLPYSIIPEWAFALWSVVHGLSVSTIGFDFSLAPSLVSFGVWLLVAFGAKRLVTSVSGDDQVEIDDDAAQWWKTIALSLGGFVLAYVVPLLVLALVLGQAVVTPFGFLRLLLFSVSALAVGFIWARGVWDIPGLRVIDPDTWDTGVRLCRRLLWGSLILSVVIIGAGLALRWDDAAETLQSYSSPAAAGIGLLIIQVLFAPGALFSALSWVAGTGVAIGGDGPSSVFHPSPGPVPEVPVLQLLTEGYPAWTAAAPVLLVLLGLLSVILGRERARAVMESSWPGLGVALACSFVIFEILALFSSGAMGPLGLSDFGPSALTAGLGVTAWIGVGLCGGLALTKLSHMQYGANSDAADQDADDDAAAIDDSAAHEIDADDVLAEETEDETR